MNFYIRFLFGIMTAVLYLCDASADVDVRAKQPCAPGCFCVNNGQMSADFFPDCSTQSQPIVCNNASGYVYAFYFSNDGKTRNELSCSNNNDGQATYYVDEFSEVYKGRYGMYGFIGDNLIVMPANINFGGATTNREGVYQCPNVYPSSEAGAKTVYDCFKYENGKKIYYTQNGSYDIRAIKSLVADLQKEVNNNQANCDLRIIRDLVSKLQKALNKSNQENITNIESVKAMIKAGISDASVKNKDLKLSEKTEAFKTSKMTTGKSMRASGNNRLGGNLEPVMNKSEKPSSNNSVDIDLETAKKMISVGI